MALKKEHDNVLCLRKTSCDSQWEVIKSRFINLNKMHANAASSVKSLRSQQKKRLNKLNTLITDLRNKIKSVKENGDQEISKLTVDVTKLYTNIMEMEAKAAIFADVNDEKYHTVWEMNENELNHLMKKILSIDKIIHDQQLGIEWSKPVNVLLNKNELSSYSEAVRTLEKIGSAKGKDVARLLQPRKKSAVANDSLNTFEVLKIASQKIASNTAWLIDSNLPPIMDRSLAERNLVKLDNVLTSLGISDATNAAVLETFFLPFIWCPNCSSGIDNKENECKNHYFVIESACIVPAITKFIRKYYHQNVYENDSDSLYVGSTISRFMKAIDVCKFWKAYVEMFPKIKEKTWTALEIGLVQYLQVLKRREKLDKECSFLRNQNDELQHLLKMYLPET